MRISSSSSLCKIGNEPYLFSPSVASVFDIAPNTHTSSHLPCSSFSATLQSDFALVCCRSSPRRPDVFIAWSIPLASGFLLVLLPFSLLVLLRGKGHPFMMPDIPGSSVHTKKNEIRPDYFGYYKHRIVELFSQNKEFCSPSASQPFEASIRASTVEDVNNHICGKSEVKSCSYSMSLFSCGIGEGLSDFKKETLNALLEQSVKDLNHEVDEILDRVVAIHEIRAHERQNQQSNASDSDKDTSIHVCKKQKMDKDFQELLENERFLSEEAPRKCSDDLLAELDHMEQHLEEFLNTIMSKCRHMTYTEKQQLVKRIRKLPAKSLGRIVDIVKHQKSSIPHASDEIQVDLEEEDEVTLWRLQHYVKLVENAN